MYYDVNEHGWKLFRQKLSGWQEAYIAKLNQKYIQILSRERGAADNFWALAKQINADKKQAGVSVDMRRSMLFDSLIDLLQTKIITLDDLDGFSDDLVANLRLLFTERE